ncbi:hypothetical protein [Caulobacter sp. NIBR1757]|uniref:hypothetical protein n=1 Tax=Caulobacter sp. NIBR1757 TaxID=3016000 RepID=UPI0022F08EB1|nr:hypothetical protein [Caulobacter sp. NIBR1757]WGM38697.1 hypothetical protein AMEJIAPC_01601 [Caulobacter sp. NIBR1757]
MKHPALLTLCLALLAGAAQAAPPTKAGEMVIEGDWSLPGRAGQVFTVKGGTGRLTAVDAAARKAGYAPGDILVQGLTYDSDTRFKNGDSRIGYIGVCRTRGAKGAWSVADCRLEVTVPADGKPTLKADPAAVLIAGQRADSQPTLAGGPPKAAPPAPAQTSAKATPAKAPAVVAQPPADPNQTWARRTMTPEELAAQDAGTARLNADINARNAAIEARNRKAEADYKAAQAAREAEINANKAAYARQMADYQARVAAQEAANAKARADWEAAVKACKAGDVSKCAQPAPK